MLHARSIGPDSQMPSVGPSAGFSVHTPSMQPFGLVGRPGRLQKPSGHCVLVLQTAPLFAPPMQRRPPHTIPPGQSAFVLHGSWAAVAQVSQKQFWPGMSVHGRTVAICVVAVVAGWKPIASVPMFLV